MSKTFKIVGNDMSDGYHTFDELYEHRILLYLNLVGLTPNAACYKKDFDEWFCLYLKTGFGQISYHIPSKYLYIVKELGIQEDPEMKWDGHSSNDVLERLKKLAT